MTNVESCFRRTRVTFRSPTSRCQTSSRRSCLGQLRPHTGTTVRGPVCGRRATVAPAIVPHSTGNCLGHRRQACFLVFPVSRRSSALQKAWKYLCKEESQCFLKGSRLPPDQEKLPPLNTGKFRGRGSVAASEPCGFDHSHDARSAIPVSPFYPPRSDRP